MEELQSLSLQQEALITEINKLQTDSIYIEKIAREKFMMVRPEKRFLELENQRPLIKIKNIYYLIFFLQSLLFQTPIF